MSSNTAQTPAQGSAAASAATTPSSGGAGHLVDDPKYRHYAWYQALEERPAEWQPFFVAVHNDNPAYRVIHVAKDERFCRFAYLQGGFCEDTSRFATRQGLVRHITSHLSTQQRRTTSVSKGSTGRIAREDWRLIYELYEKMWQWATDADYREDNAGDNWIDELCPHRAEEPDEDDSSE